MIEVYPNRLRSRDVWRESPVQNFVGVSGIFPPYGTVSFGMDKLLKTSIHQFTPLREGALRPKVLSPQAFPKGRLTLLLGNSVV